jgi:hypothetical protein
MTRASRPPRPEPPERTWREDRDADAADRDVPVDEYPGSDELAWLNKEFRG